MCLQIMPVERNAESSAQEVSAPENSAQEVIALEFDAQEAHSPEINALNVSAPGMSAQDASTFYVKKEISSEERNPEQNQDQSKMKVSNSGSEVAMETDGKLSVIKQESAQLRIRDAVSLKNCGKVLISLLDYKLKKGIETGDHRSLIKKNIATESKQSLLKKDGPVQSEGKNRKTIFQCTLCTKYFKSLQEIRKHVENRCKGRSAVTSKCSAVPSECIGHKVSTFKDNDHNDFKKCPKCNTKFNTQNALECHIKSTHTKSRGLPMCRGCNRGFLSHDDLCKHQKSQMCLLCKQCMMQCELTGHIEKHHNEEIFFQISLVPSDQSSVVHSDPIKERQESSCINLKEERVSSADNVPDSNQWDFPWHFDEQHNKGILEVLPDQSNSIPPDQTKEQTGQSEALLLRCHKCSTGFLSTYDFHRHQMFRRCQLCGQSMIQCELPRHIDEKHNKDISKVPSDQNSRVLSVQNSTKLKQENMSKILCEETPANKTQENSAENFSEEEMTSNYDNQGEYNTDDYLINRGREICLKTDDKMALGNIKKPIKYDNIEQGFVSNGHNIDSTDDSEWACFNQARITTTYPVRVGEFVVKEEGKAESQGPFKSSKYSDRERQSVAAEADREVPDPNIWVEPDPSTVTVISPLQGSESDSESEGEHFVQIIPQGIPGNSVKFEENGNSEEEQNIFNT